MTINERMNHIIKELYGGNKRAFANAIGVSATVIENVVGTRQGKPSQTQYTPPDQNIHYFIEKIAEQAEEIGKLKEQVKLLGTQQSAAPDAICADVV